MMRMCILILKMNTLDLANIQFAKINFKNKIKTMIFRFGHEYIENDYYIMNLYLR